MDSTVMHTPIMVADVGRMCAEVAARTLSAAEEAQRQRVALRQREQHQRDAPKYREHNGGARPRRQQPSPFQRQAGQQGARRWPAGRRATTGLAAATTFTTWTPWR